MARKRKLSLLVAPAPTVVTLAVALITLVIVVVAIMLAFPFTFKVLALVTGALNFVHAVFTIPVLAKRHDLVFRQSGRQVSLLNHNPGPVITGRPEPVVAV